MTAESQETVLARIDERTKNTDQKLNDLVSRLETHYVSKDALEVMEQSMSTLGNRVSEAKRDIKELTLEVHSDYATCDRVTELERSLLPTETASKLKELVESDEPEKRAVTRGDIAIMQKLVYGAVAMVLLGVLTAAMAFIIHTPK